MPRIIPWILILAAWTLPLQAETPEPPGTSPS